MTPTCADIKPDWDGTPVSMITEAITLAASPVSLILLAVTLIAVRCLGSPTLFIAAVAAICVGMILYTAPTEARKT